MVLGLVLAFFNVLGIGWGGVDVLRTLRVSSAVGQLLWVLPLLLPLLRVLQMLLLLFLWLLLPLLMLLLLPAPWDVRYCYCFCCQGSLCWWVYLFFIPVLVLWLSLLALLSYFSSLLIYCAAIVAVYSISVVPFTRNSPFKCCRICCFQSLYQPNSFLLASSHPACVSSFASLLLLLLLDSPKVLASASSARVPASY